jgi:hypothetical protein
MPALDTPSAQRWLELHEPALCATTGDAVLPVETTRSVDAALTRLGRSLDIALDREPTALSARLQQTPTSHRLVALLNELGTARKCLLLEWLARSHFPDHRALLAALLDTPDAGPRLRASLLSLNRRALLARIFAPDRLRILLAACRTNQKDSL